MQSDWSIPVQDFTSLLRACYGLKIADKKTLQLLKLAENEDKVKY